MMSEKKQTENSENKTGEKSKETPPKQKSKLTSPVKKTNEVKKLKNKSNDGIVPKQVKRTSSADGPAKAANVDATKVKGKDGPAVSPRMKPKSSKEHGPRRKDMKAFVIPRMAKEKELLEEVSLDSNSFQKYLLPAIVQQYRDPASRASFQYEKAFLVHNEKLNTEFQERRKELKEEGRSDRELAEQYSFLLVDNMDIAEVICNKGLHARWTGDAKERQLGRGEMGVYLNRYSDILSSSSLEIGKEYILLVLKVLKGKVKAVPLTHHKEGIEPTPKFDSHVAKNIVVTSTNRFQTFVSNQIYCYQFGELNMEERPKQVCPFAVVSFRCCEKKEANTNSSGFETQVSTVKKDAGSNKADSSKGPKKPAPMSTAFATSITLWKGKLANQGKELCSASLVSSRLPFLPTELPRRLDLATAIPVSKVKNIMPSDISKHPKLCHLSRHHEVSAKGRYFTYAQMRSVGDKKAFTELFRCLKDNQMALHTKTTSNKQVFVIPPCSLTEELHVSKPAKICVLHILFVSNKTSYRKLSDAVVKSSSKDDDGPSLPVYGRPPKTSDLRAQLGRLFQQENTFYIAENERRKPTTPARISPAARNSRTSSQEITGDSARSSTENTPVAVLKDATNSYPSESKSVPNQDPGKLNADIPVVVPYQSGRLEHVEGSFSPIEEEEVPSKEDQKGANNISEPGSDGLTALGTSDIPLGERENIPGQSSSFGHPPKPTRVFSNQSHLPEINHQLNQLLRTQEIIASTSSSALETPPGEKDTVEDYQNKIRQLRSNLDSLLRERANLKHSQELEASFQSQQMTGRHLPTLSSHHTPTQHFMHHHSPINSSHDSAFLPATNNEHEPFLGNASQHTSEFPKSSSKENRSQIFNYLQDILSSPFLKQEGNSGTEERHEKQPSDPLSPAGLTLDSLRSILDRVQGQSPSVSDFPTYPLSMQHHDISMDPSTSMRPGPSHLGVSPTSSDVENNNKRQRDEDETSASKRQRTVSEDSNTTMAKLASILSSVSKAANVPTTPQSPPPWETLSLVHKEIPPETPESPPPWDRCNDTSNQGEEGAGDQWSRNVVLKEDQSKQLTVTIKGHPVQRHTQEGSSDLYSLVKTVLHGVTRKMASAALRNENDFAPPTQQEVHLQELVLSTLHVQNPGNSQIQFGASRKVEEVARPLQENHTSSSSQRTSPRSSNSSRTSSSVSTGSNHSESPTGKSRTNRSSIIEDGTSFLGDLTSEDGVSVDLPYYRKKSKERHRKSSSNAKVPKHRSSDSKTNSSYRKSHHRHSS